MTRRETRRTRRVRWLAALLGAFVLALSVMPVTAWAAPGENSLEAVYVSSTGDDENGDGSQGSPLATLAKAVDAAKDDGTIYVMSDLTMTESARYYGKDLTITSGDGGPYTLTRGENFAANQDSARSTYNPALIEVDSTSGPNTASLTLKNIVLDDAGIHEGEYFVQAESYDPDDGSEYGYTTVGSSEVQNTSIVQDGMIATYNGVGTITLGDGAVLKNYGGMCAVRLSSGTLIMEDGSQIIDDREIAREKGTTGSFGPAGAIWLQGGTLTMNGGVIGGAEGTVMTGRAVYVDSGTANIGGTLQNLEGTDAAWQGQNGVAVHLRSHGEATLTATGKITNVTGANSGNNCAIWTQYCNFTADRGSVISEVDGFQLLHFDDLDNNNYSHEVYLDGTISNCASGSACLLRSWYGQITFGPNSVIEGCSSSSAGGLIYSNNGSHYTFAGTIRNNRASNGMIYLANQGGGGVVATIESTAHIVDNTGLGVRVNNSSNLTMDGGEIARNSGAGVRVSAKDSWKGVTFIMNDGVIADNGDAGVDATIGGDSVVQLNGGSIYGNGSDAEVEVWNDYTDSPNAYGDSVNDHLYIADGVLQGSRTVMVQHGYDDILGLVSLNRTLGTVTLDEGHGEVAWAFANPDAVTKLTALVTSDPLRVGWKAAMEDAYWIKPYADSYHFMVTRPSDAIKTDLYLAYIPLNDDGSVPDDATLAWKKVGSGNQIDVTMDGLDANKSYAFMFFNSSEYTIAADSVTKYIGGGAGDETKGNGFPELTIDGSVDPIKNLEIDGSEVSGDDLMASLLENIEAEYRREDGTLAADDSEPGAYTITLKWKNDLTNEKVRINGNNVNLDGVGTLIIRHIDDVDGAQSGDTTHELLVVAPETPVESAAAMAKGSSPEFYTNDDEGRQADSGGIQLLDDDLLVYGGEDRRTPMEEKAAGYLGEPGEGRAYRYEFHYLDLVDAFNGNAWVSASGGTTVWLPYPEGVDSTNAESLGLTVLHYKDLHREYGITGQENVDQAIADCKMEEMSVTYDTNGIKFDVDRSGFSPFAVVWQTEAHTITASAGNGGTIAPSGAVTVAEGADQTFTITASQGYEVADVTVDGGSVGDVTTYTFKAVAADHKIEATFRSTSGGGGSVTPSERYTITASAGEGGSISPSGTHEYAAGSDVTFTIAPDEGWTVGDVTVDGVSYRQLGSYTFEDLDDDHTISVTFMRGSDPASPDETGVSDWLETDEHVAYLHGYGDGSGKFGPENPMTRAEVAQMFYNLLLDKSRGDRQVAFEDVPEGAYYEEAVLTLASRGILNGTGPTSFEPNRAITRAEFVAIAMRFSNGEFEGENPYADVPEDAWYRDYVVGATSFGWIYGYQDGSGRFGPDDTITRGQATMVTNRMLWRSCDTAWALGHLDELKTFVDLGQEHYAFFDVVEATNAHDYERAGDTRFEDWTGLRE